MKLQHSLGGLEGLGPVDYDKRVFVQEWEKRIFGIHAALMGLSDSLRTSAPQYDLDATGTTFHSTWTWADLRKGAEAMNPIDYFKYRYYEKWLGGITAFCAAQGYASPHELQRVQQASRPASKGSDGAGSPIDEQVMRYLREGDSPRRGPSAPRFTVGQRVVIGNPPATEHTRLPGYLRGRTGIVQAVSDSNYTYLSSTGADGLGDPVPVYVVRFEADEIWGDMTEVVTSPVYAELYEPYLTAPNTQKDSPRRLPSSSIPNRVREITPTRFTPWR